MNGLMRSTIALTVVSVAAVLSGPALAATTELGPVANMSALSAGSGWVTWSERQADAQWHLVTFHDGQRTEPRIKPRHLPFDANVGTDRPGQVVITYSRCTENLIGPLTPQGHTVVSIGGNGIARPLAQRGCRMFALDPVSGTETRIPVPGSRGASDTTPSMYMGNLVFGRLVKGSTIAQLLYLGRGGTKLTKLAGGSLPFKYTRRQARAQELDPKWRFADIEQLDLGADRVAYTWFASGYGIDWSEGQEVRVADLRGRGSRLYATGGQYGMDAPGFVDQTSPSLTDSGDLWFTSIAGYDGVRSSRLAHGTSTKVGGVTLPAPIWGLAIDGTTMYSVQGPAPALNEYGSEVPAPCATGCKLVSEPLPAPLARTKLSNKPLGIVGHKGW